MPTRASAIASGVAAATLALALASCVAGELPGTAGAASQSPTGTGSSTGAPSQQPATPTPGGGTAPALPGDAVLWITATATAPSGAELALTMIVGESVAWNSDAAQQRQTRLAAACPGALDADVFASQAWGFAVAGVSATATDGTWPATAPILVQPDPGFLTIARGDGLAHDAGVPAETPGCLRDATVVGPVTSDVVVGFVGDAGAAPGTRWANHRWGFSSTVATISDCAWGVTELGAARNGDATWWGEFVDPGSCVVGAVTEQADS